MVVGRANHLASQARKKRVLAEIAKGATIEQATKTVGLAKDTYYHWRKTDDGFRQQVDAIRRQAVADTDAAEVRWSGDFRSFRKAFFGFDTYAHQDEMVRAMETCPPGGVTLITLPPEHGKTTTIHDRVCEKVARDQNSRITYVSEGIGHARKAVRRIQRRLTDRATFKAFIDTFGPFRLEADTGDGMVRAWSMDFFTVAGATHDEQDYTFEARGWKSSIAGTRCDLLIVDDIQSRKSLNLTGAMVESFQQDMLTRPGKEGRTVIIGTRVGTGDFYEKILEGGLVDRHVVLPATNPDELVPCEDTGCDVNPVDVDGLPHHERPLCPELWDGHSLARRRRQVGEEVWWRTYQQKPRMAGDATFTEAMWAACENPLRGIEMPTASDLRIAGLDPALGGGNSITVAAGSVDRFAVVDNLCDRGFSRTEQILQRIEEVAARWRITDLVVEAVAFQRGLANDDRLIALANRYGFRIWPHQTGMNKLDESIGVASMATSFLLKEFDIPAGSEEARRRLASMREEFLSWRPNVPTKQLVQDRVMSTWFAWLFWMERRRNFGVDLSAWKRPPMPVSPMGLLLPGRAA